MAGLANLQDAKAQSIDDLGVVWSKTYGQGTILNIKHNPGGTYTACGYTWIDGVSSKYERLEGLVVEFDESGNELQRATARIPQYYINSHPGSSISDDASARFSSAFKTDDGGYLAFGYFYNPGAPVGEKEYSWNTNDFVNSQYIATGIWIVKFDAGGTVIKDTLVNGRYTNNGWAASDTPNTYVIGGLDRGQNIDRTLIRRYNKNGEIIADHLASYGEMNIFNQNPDGSFIATTGQTILNIPQSLSGISSIAINTALTPETGVNRWSRAITPTTDGGYFLTLNLHSVSTDYTQTYAYGNGLYRINAAKTASSWYKITIPGDTMFHAPLLLPGSSNPPKYIGTASLHQTSYQNITGYRMYELTDSLTSYSYRVGNAFPNGTALNTVSQVDGFFSCGTDSPGHAAIAKLSTCAKFKLNVGSTSENLLTNSGTMAFAGRHIGYSGENGTVSYSWTLTDITPGGIATDVSSTVTGAPNTSIPPATFTLLPGKSFALLQYVITAVDSYTANGVPQTCQQTQNILLRINSYPDNISDADCFTAIPSIAWSIEAAFTSNTSQQTMTAYATPLVGDLDGDRVPEILVYNFVSANDPRTVNKVYVFWGNNRGNPTEFSIPTTSYMHPMGALARVEIGGVMTPILVFQATDGYLYAYNPQTGQPITAWNGGGVNGRSNAKINDWVAETGATAVTPQAVGFADFDGDGKVEVYASRSVWAAENGKLLVQGAGNKGYVQAGGNPSYKHYYTVAADFTDDGIVELAAGTHVYEVHTPYRDGINAANTMNIKYQIGAQTANGLSITDGTTIVADVNRNGKLDVIVTSNNGGSNYGILVWEPGPTSSVVATGGSTGVDYPATPFAGNIDSNPDMEILYITNNRLDGWRYNNTTTLQRPYTLSHTDGSGATGITMFDFNSDNIPELVYRDQDNLRIMQANAATGTITNLQTFPCGSGTYKEYPIVADVDGEGSSAILVMGGASNATSPATLRIYKSAGLSWAPARKVWNQYNYNVVNINEDLTVPRYQMSPATVFPGSDGMTGTADDVRPYNNFLQQQTSLNRNGKPLWLAPRSAIDSTFYRYDAAKDSMYVTLDVVSLGSAAFVAPLHITVYKNAVGNAVKHTYTYLHSINAGDTARITFGIPAYLATWGNDVEKLVARINDAGNGFNEQAVCDSTYRDVASGPVLLAMHDRALTATALPVIVNVLANDTVPSGCTPVLSILTPTTPHGSATLAGAAMDSIRYTPAAGFAGFDTLVYRIACGTEYSSDAYIYIYVAERPDNISDADCYIDPLAQKWGIRETALNTAATVHNYASLTAGDIDGDGTVEILGFIENASTNNWYESNGIKIYYFDKSTQQVKFEKSFTFKPVNESTITTVSTFGSMAIARYNNKGYIVVAGIDYHLYAYDENGVRLWKSDYPHHTASGHYGALVNIADFNADGIPEVYAGNTIFSLADGERICAGGTSNNYGVLAGSGCSSMAADIDGDGILELCAGTQIYKVDIAAKSMTVWKELTRTLPSNATKDGATQVADIDNDGQLEIVVISKVSNSAVPNVVYVWKPMPGAGSYITGSFATANSSWYSVPMIGNIDTDPYPEIVFIGTATLMYALDFNPAQPAGSQISLMWTLSHNDGSACTGMSLFDFNQDGRNEIVYRDQEKLRIIDGNYHGGGALPAANVLSTFMNVASLTLRELPLVVDIDDDGQAEIVVQGHTSAQSYTGYVRVFKTDGSPWAPARKVWNQYAYNAVNVNDDLTIPRYQMNPTTVFPGADGIMGTSDDVRPYNNFLQQQTALNMNGTRLWLTPDVLPVGNPVYEYFNDGDSLRVTFTVENRGDAAAVAPFYTGVYRNEVTAATHVHTDSIMQMISPGATVTHTAVIPHFTQVFDLSDSLILRLNDRGGTHYVQQECDTTNNATGKRVSAILQMRNDTRTVQKYHWTEIDVLANDMLPDGLFSPGPFSLRDSVVQQPVAGRLSGIGAGRGSRLIYLNSGTENLPAQIDSFIYRFRIYDPGTGGIREFRATAYIYILEEIHGAAACHGRSFTATLRELPAGVGFKWYTVADTAFLSSGPSCTFGGMAGDSSRLVKPSVPDTPGHGTASWNREGGFPPGLLTVYAAGASRPMRWTGMKNTDWYNPENWVETVQAGGSTYESPVSWPPSACTEVVISSGAGFYPELTDSAWCRTITVQDRALLVNPHALNYDSARVELKLKATERDRFIMWSAPLKDMYSGDYHFKDAAGQPRWGDVYMNYFQLANPAGGAAQANMFTATFGEPGDRLRPGKAFNLRVTGTSVSRDQPLIFPQSATTYTPLNKPAVSTPRTVSHRFITDGVVQDGNGRFSLPVENDVAAGQLVQVVNPYLAWLRADSFLVNNGAKLAPSGYLIWDGDVNSSFIATKVTGTEGMRYSVSTSPGMTDKNLIAPLQSFFVAKISTGSLVGSVLMSPRWTTTASSGWDQEGYTLRAAEAESGVLRIRASQGNRTASAALHFDKLSAVPEYRGSEDVRALFYDASPLSVYVLTPQREPLAISADGEYQTHTTALGLRLAESGEVTLSFTGQERFGHDVYLIDRERGSFEIFLQETPSYTFTAVRPSGASAFELNDRFVLRMEYTGVGNAPVTVLRPEVTVGAGAGCIHVHTLSGRIERIDVYNLLGMSLYSLTPNTDEFDIPVAGAQTYIVKVRIDGGETVKKVIVK
ncbi:MAG: hypothetical protein LBB90_07410 [Tannerella sp.]|nr:hypothetical protein [Tannerella sp.]